MTVRIQHADFDLSTEVAALRAANPKVGAVVCFVGAVRDVSEQAQVSAMTLEHYPEMTEKSLEAIAAQAKQRWLDIDILIIHRIGVLYPLDQIVLVAVTAPHRQHAFCACEYVMDYLKTQAPFWKKETTLQGEHWVDARACDEAALERWAPQSAAPMGNAPMGNTFDHGKKNA